MDEDKPEVDRKNRQPKAQKGMDPAFEPLGQAFLRIPLLPIETLRHAAEEAMTLAGDPLLHEAIFVASTSLIDSLSRSQTIPPKKVRQLHSSLLRYIIRMSSRTTPFGLFAGVAQIDVGEHTDVPLGSASGHRHRTRPDMEWLLGYIQLLENDPKIQSNLVYTYQPVSTRIGNRYHFEHRDEKGKLTNTSVIATYGVERLIEKTKRGMKYADLFREMLADIPEATPEEMTAFLDKFIRYGIIYSSLRPPLTRPDPSRYVVAQLSDIPGAQTVARKLRALLDHVARYDACPPGAGEGILRSLIAEAGQIHRPPSEHIPFHVDLKLRFTRNPRLQRSLAMDAARLAELLLKLSERGLDATHLSAYRPAFVERYGHHRLVPVLEVLNPSIGLGLPAHYTHGMHRQKEMPYPSGQSDRDRLLLKLAIKAAHEKQMVLNLDDATIDQLTNPQFNKSSLPQSLDIAVQIAAASQEHISRGDYLLVSSPLTGTHVAGRTAGRFADMLGAEATHYLQEIADMQAVRGPDRLYAELVYLPQAGHTANVAIRPALRRYEVTVGTAPGVMSDYVLPLSDLFVGMRDKRLCLWSATHRKEVIVQAGHMLNMVNAPSVCRFLIEASTDTGLPLVAFSWGTAAQLPMLPRVTHGRLVLSLARWTLENEDVLRNHPHAKNGEPPLPQPAVWQARIRTWRNDWRVPRFVYLIERDNRLLLDLDNEAHVMELFYAASYHGKPRTLHLQEALPGPESAWVAGPEGHYLSECIFQLARKPSASPAPQQEYSGDSQFSARARQEISPAERMHMPGSEWLYCKLYLPAQQQNEYLATYIEQLVRAVTERHAADTWFFIRYADPEPHIRLRFKANETTLLQTLLPIVVAWTRQMQAAGLLQKFSIDSYDREIERYGGKAAMAVAEAIFAAESETDMRLIRLSENGSLNDLMLPDVAVLTTSVLLAAFGLDDAQQITWVKGRVSYKPFAQEYRSNRQKILCLIQAYRESSMAQQDVQKICRQLRRKLLPLGRIYRKLEANGELTLPLREILGSFVHMHCNRLLGMDRLREQRNLAYLERALADLPKWQRGVTGIS